MPRVFGVSLSVLIIVGAFFGQVVPAMPAAAASVTTTGNAELRSGPGYENPVVVTVQAGTALSIDGPPQFEFYPVTIEGGQSGWIPGHVLHIVKETEPAAVAIGSEHAPGAPAAAWEAQEVAQEAAPPADGPAELVAVPEETAADPTAMETQVDPAAATVESAPVDAATSPDAPPPDPTDAAAAEAPPADPAATTEVTTDSAAAESAPEAGNAATEEAALAVDEATIEAAPADAAATEAGAAPPPADAEATAVASMGPEPTPEPAPELAANGPATASAPAHLYASPSAGSGVLFVVPAGSTVWQLGEARNGFVHVDYMAMIGWVATELLTQPAEPAPEIIPESAPTAENLRTPRPGSGVAFAEVELTLRAGPSANEAALDVIPAGTRVVMTGVMENGFHRVDFRGQLGWVASDYLHTPPDPTATPEPTRQSDDSNRTSQRNRREYSRDQIVKIIYSAADRYGQSRSDMLRVAECESALDPYAVHPSGSYGLYQFIRATWKETPYGDQDVFDPRANANAAGWMWAQGRRADWVCK